MIHRLLRAFVVALATSICAGTVSAAEAIYTFSSGPWSGGAYLSEATGKFNHCSIQASYESGIIVSFGINARYELQMMLDKQDWSLNVGDTYGVTLSVDGRSLGTYDTKALDSTVVFINLDNNSVAFRLMKWGRVLRVTTASRSFKFKLTGTARALDRVKQCVDTAVALSSDRHNPFAGGSNNPFGQPVSRKGTDGERTDRSKTIDGSEKTNRNNLQRILEAAGITDPQFLSNEKTKEIPGLIYAWESEGVFGFVLQIESEKESEDTGVATTLGVLGSDCQGNYATGTKRPRQIGKYVFKEGFATCAERDRTSRIFITAMFGESAGMYFGLQADGEAAERAEKSANRLREILEQAVQM